MGANIHDIYNTCIELFWLYKIEVITGILFGIFSFVLEYYKEIKRFFSKFKKKSMADIKDMSRDELEHDALQSQLNELKNSMHSGFDIIQLSLDRIYEQTKRTNGRVTRLEDDTDFILVLKKYKWLFVLTVIGVYTIFKALDIAKLINKLI